MLTHLIQNHTNLFQEPILADSKYINHRNAQLSVTDLNRSRCKTSAKKKRIEDTKKIAQSLARNNERGDYNDTSILLHRLYKIKIMRSYKL